MPAAPETDSPLPPCPGCAEFFNRDRPAERHLGHAPHNDALTAFVLPGMDDAPPGRLPASGFLCLGCMPFPDHATLKNDIAPENTDSS